MSSLGELLNALKEGPEYSEWYETMPVSAEEFFSNQYYCGDMVDSIFPCWRRELLFVLDPKNEIKEWIIYGGLGIGKSVAALLSQLYILYKLTCMRSPQKAFGLAPHFPLYLAFFNISKAKAEESLASRLLSLVNMSPYFRENLPKNLRKVFVPHGAGIFGPGYREHPKKDDLFELVLPHNIHLLFGSKTSHALSLDVFSAILDEMNFRRKKSISEQEDEDSAENLYSQIYRRITSRFVNHPGLLINISSAKAQTSFVEKRIAEVQAGKVKHVHVSAFAHWEARPDRYTSGKKFYVFLGSEFRRSRILDPGEEIELQEGEMIVEVPEELREDFTRNLEMALRDLAGIATVDVNKLFTDPEPLIAAIDEKRTNPISEDIIYTGRRVGTPIETFFDLDAVSKFNGIERRLKYFPGVRRFIHVDLARTKDRVGIACGCIPKFLHRKTKNPTTDEEIIQRLPYLFVDFALAVKSPHDDEISFESIRQFVLWVSKTPGYVVESVTYDSWQSVHSIELLQASGLNAASLSVDRTDEPYLELASAFRESRVSVPSGVDILMHELRELVHDITSRQGKVDHPHGGSKDVADAVCGVYANAIAWMESVGWAAPGVEKITDKIIAQQLTPVVDAKAKKTQKWLNMPQPVHLDDSLDEKVPW